MKRTGVAALGFVLGSTLFGCATPPEAVVVQASAAVPAPTPSVPAPVALVPSSPPQITTITSAPAPVWIVPPSHHVARAGHPIVHRHLVRLYAMLPTNYFGSPCGSDAHPCSVFHTIMPIQ